MILTVSELTLQIKSLLEPKFSEIEIKGEISNLKIQSSGHVYFTLKDEKSQISVALFQGFAAKLLKKPKDGDQVIVKGELTIYPPRGSYQIVAKGLEFLGLGDLLIKLHELKEEIRQLGWFNKEHKKPLPKLPHTIGVVTSPTGAVIHDIIHVLSRRFRGFRLILYPVKVQGEGAKEEIAKAIDHFNQYQLADVLIVGRGGGSIEDLFAFNEKCVAEAIFRSKIPIISAVGHETDFTIADFVADVRAPTPSAAAEMVILEKANLFDKLMVMKKRLDHSLTQHIKQLKIGLDRMMKDPFFKGVNWIATPTQRLDMMIERIDQAHLRYLEKKRGEVRLSKIRLHQLSPEKWLETQKERLFRLNEHLKSVNPKQILTRGYCIPFHKKNDSVILSSTHLEEGEAIKLLFHDGTVGAQVNGIRDCLQTT